MEKVRQAIKQLTVKQQLQVAYEVIANALDLEEYDTLDDVAIEISLESITGNLAWFIHVATYGL